MATIRVRDNRLVVDYLARDYASFRQALVDRIPAKLPEWKDPSEADFGIVLIELLSYMADILSYYQDRIANEAFLSTAVERRSVIEHLRLIGYEMAPAAPAAAALDLIVGNSVNDIVEVRKGDQFATPTTRDRPSLTFEYVGDEPLLFDLSTLAPNSALKPDGSPWPNFKMVSQAIPVREGRTIVREVVGVSDGSPNQRFRLAQPRVLRDTVEVLVDTVPPTPAWRVRTNLIFSGRAFTPEELAALEYQERIGSTLAFSREPDTDVALQTDENDVTTILFGDGQYGAIPPANTRILASYRTGGGVTGNVGAAQITVISKAPQLQLIGAKVTNPLPASGGADRESIEHAVRFAPSVFTSMNRAVTADDYVSQARLFPGVSKARAEATNWNTVRLFIAPTGAGEDPTDTLKRDLLQFFEDKRMLTTVIEIESPTYVRIVIQAKVEAKPFFRNEDVRADVERAVAGLLTFEKVDFRQILYLSKVYEAIESRDGVASVFVSEFRRATDTTPVPSDGRIVLGGNELPVLRENDLLIEASGGV